MHKSYEQIAKPLRFEPRISMQNQSTLSMLHTKADLEGYLFTCINGLWLCLKSALSIQIKKTYSTLSWKSDQKGDGHFIYDKMIHGKKWGTCNV